VARKNEILEYIVRSCHEVKIVDDPRAVRGAARHHRR
jgi:hypothetical protein